MAPHSSTLAWKIPWMEEPGGLQSTFTFHFHFSLARIGEGNGNPLQCSCLEKPRDGGAWWAAIYGVAQSPTRLKQLSSSSSEEELNSLLMKVKEESEKAGLKFNIQKTKVMASSHITTWQIDREKVETVSDFIFLGSKITVDGDCSHKIKRCLFLERKAMANLNSVLKSRDITLLTKVHNIVKAMVSPVVTYGCESWTIKKAEHRRTDAFELWCWRRLLGVPWTTRSSNQSILKEINPEYSLEGLMLKLKLQHLGHLMRSTDSLEKTLMVGMIEGKRRRE